MHTYTHEHVYCLINGKREIGTEEEKKRTRERERERERASEHVSFINGNELVNDHDECDARDLQVGIHLAFFWE